MNLCDGVGIPAILLVGEELCDNRFFDEDIDGWSDSNVTLTHKAYETHLGSYVLEINDASIANAGYTYYQTLADIGSNQILFFSVWVKAVSSESYLGRLAFYDLNTLLGWKTFRYSNNWEIYSLILTEADIIDGRLIIRIYPAHEASETADIYIINPKIRVVNEIIYLDNPTNRRDLVDPIEWWKVETDNLNRYNNDLLGVRRADSLNFEYSERISENAKLRAMESRRVIYYPHLDADACYLIRFDVNQPLIYFQDKYLGHNSQFGIISLETRDAISLKEGW